MPVEPSEVKHNELLLHGREIVTVLARIGPAATIENGEAVTADLSVIRHRRIKLRRCFV